MIPVMRINGFIVILSAAGGLSMTYIINLNVSPDILTSPDQNQ
jgi:hypothetical protein